MQNATAGSAASDGTLRDPLADLPPTALRMVEATQRLLVSRGYTAVTLEAIGEACQLNKIAVKYYFGNKAGLMTLLLDSLVYESCVVMAALVGAPPEASRLHEFLEAKRRWTEGDSQFAFLELYPHVVRNASERERLIGMYEMLIAQYRKFFGAYVPGASDDEVRGLAQLVIAIVDGLSIQHRMSKTRFAVSVPFAVLESVWVSWMSQHQLLAREALPKGEE
jgi:AcrR family transcriptional regulator